MTALFTEAELDRLIDFDEAFKTRMAEALAEDAELAAAFDGAITPEMTGEAHAHFARAEKLDAARADDGEIAVALFQANEPYVRLIRSLAGEARFGSWLPQGAADPELSALLIRAGSPTLGEACRRAAELAPVAQPVKPDAPVPPQP